MEKKITKEELAKLLNGNEYGREITKELEQQAKDNGLVVVTGSNDLFMEFKGAIKHEFICVEGGEVNFTKEGVEATDDDIETLKRFNIATDFNTIETIYDQPFGDNDEICLWQYKTEIPHSTFKIFEDGSLYCVGIIFERKDLK